MRGDAKPTTISPFVNIRVAAIPRITGQPLIPVTGVNDRKVTQNPYHHIHSLCFRPRIWIGDALQKRFAIQQGSIWSGDVKILGKILRIPADVRLQCGPNVVSIQLDKYFAIGTV